MLCSKKAPFARLTAQTSERSRKIHLFAGRAVKRKRRKGSSRRQQTACVRLRLSYQGTQTNLCVLCVYGCRGEKLMSFRAHEPCSAAWPAISDICLDVRTVPVLSVAKEVAALPADRSHLPWSTARTQAGQSGLTDRRLSGKKF